MRKPSILQWRRRVARSRSSAPATSPIHALPALAPLLSVLLASAVFGQHSPPPEVFDPSRPPSLIYKVMSVQQRLEMTVNASRRLEMDQKIPEAQVNNPDIVDLTPLAPNVVQVSAKNPGVTQVNLWGEDKQIYTIDVIVYRDVRELELLLESQFPNAKLKVVPVGNGVMISGYVDQPEQVSLITRIAEEYYPKVIPAMTVSGVHQILLHVRVMEVSRTKLRSLGFDFAQFSGDNYVVSSVSGLLSAFGGGVATSGQETFSFGVVDGSSAFFGVLEAMRQDQLMKILAEPTLVTVSGRPAFFQVGGEFPILVPQSLGTVSIEYKKFGTQVDFVPIVLGNGRIRLEVRPRVSEIDNTRSVTLDSTTVPGLRTREVDTGVELNAGQTLAIAGLVQTRVESENKGLPWASEVPYLGALFRRVRHYNNEIELLILVTPELVEAMDVHEVPLCGPGSRTTDPNDWDLFMRGHLEVPNCCPPCGMDGVSCPSGGQAGLIGGWGDGETPDEMVFPGEGEIVTPPNGQPPTVAPSSDPTLDGSTSRSNSPTGQQGLRRPMFPAQPSHTATRPHSPSMRQNPQPAPNPAQAEGRLPAPVFIGPVGYDVLK